MNRKIAFVCAFALLNAAFSPAWGQIPELIRYQGTLTDSNGNALEGNYNLTFRFYDAASGGTQMWEEAQSAVPVTKGSFSVLLGQVNPLNLRFDVDCWLAVSVNGGAELTPRHRVASVPNAYLARSAEKLVGPPLYTVGSHVGIGTPTPSRPLDLSSDPGEGALLAYFEHKNQVRGDGLRLRLPEGSQWEFALDLAKRGAAGQILLALANGRVRIGPGVPQYELDVKGYVHAAGYFTGDMVFQKEGQPLWRMYEDEGGLYLESLSSGRHYHLTMQEVQGSEIPEGAWLNREEVARVIQRVEQETAAGVSGPGVALPEPAPARSAEPEQ